MGLAPILRRVEILLRLYSRIFGSLDRSSVGTSAQRGEYRIQSSFPGFA
ncbi:hypothetical protein LEP1GSC188_1397 [Leptospira weilii serovar Topaz str. LT2116]|uniref:Uncharacterized protein n=1 Tax=Leptospira weilii serovar Topaz str. LT2116 TaxID=1088540 RepID=M3FT95_9LEPT|nr:hypothetical protein LEP1GSC188_1397 [Leptospira weilii serovar Topaz str. LT2116]